MARFINPRPAFRPNSKLFFFRSGTNTQLVTYKDQFETTGLENTHPVLTDSAGVVPNIFFSGSAKLVLQDENSVQYGEYDPISGEAELGNFTLWEVTITYDINDIVEGSDGEFYKSLSNGNIGNDPVTTPTAWEQIRFIGVWNTNITYSIGDVVQSTLGNLWKALTATAGNDPETDDGTNWAVAISELSSDISSPTNLISGRNYVSTATASHVVPAVSGGAPIKITWLDGTVMTLTSASNMSVTTNIKTTDTTWVFEDFISTLTLVDTGTEWEIK